MGPHGEATNGKALACLLLSIGNLCCLPFVLSLPSVILGVLALGDVRRRAVGGLGLAVSGIVLSIVGDVVYAAVLVVVLLVGLRADPQQPAPPVDAPLPNAADDPEAERIYLTTLKPAAISPQAPLWNGGPAGELGDGRRIEIDGGRQAAKGLSIGPPAVLLPQAMFVEYQLRPDLGPCVLHMQVGLDDSSGPAEKPGIVFEVLGNGKLLWTSRTIRRIGAYHTCRIKVAGVDRLTLRYRSLDPEPNQRWTLPVWIDPYLIPLAKLGGRNGEW